MFARGLCLLKVINGDSAVGYIIPASMCNGCTVPGIAAALVNWGVSSITLIEDTSMLWDQYCLIRLSVQYRGRAIPLVWRVIRHGSSSIRFDVYQAMLKLAERLIPQAIEVCFLADRGNASTALMRYLRSGNEVAFPDSSGVSAREASPAEPPCQK